VTSSDDIGRALEAFIRDEVRRQVDAALAERDRTATAAPPTPSPLASPAAPKAWLSTVEAAHLSGRHPETVAKACRNGELFATQRGRGGSWRIRPESLDAWIEGAPDPHQEAVERWQRGPKQPLKPRKPRRPGSDPDGPAAA